jgi:hypothetical protein
MGLFSKRVGTPTARVQPDRLSCLVDDAKVTLLTPGTAYRPTPKMTRKATPRSAKAPKNPVLDRSGTIVGLSDRPQPRPLQPVDHARLFVDWLQQLDGFAGQRVVVSVVKRLYEGFCKETNLRTFNWRRVAGEIRKITNDKKRYGRVSSGNGIRRERVYLIPKGGASLAAELALDATGP